MLIAFPNAICIAFNNIIIAINMKILIIISIDIVFSHNNNVLSYTNTFISLILLLL